MEFLFLKIILRGDIFYKLWSVITKIGKLIYTFILGIQAKYLFLWTLPKQMWIWDTPLHN
jgi:hypothetical protein